MTEDDIRGRPHFYRLVGQTPVPCSTEEYGESFGRDDRRVALTIVGPFRISTVFLSIDHNFLNSGPPTLFETMTFLDAPADHELRAVEQENEQDGRTCTWLEAEAQHRKAVDWCRTNMAAPGDPVTELVGEETSTVLPEFRD
ncbi:MAG TPA: hypothetical protein VFO36_08730 [Nitrospiraceae bacterium]|nr:hypothetical protein [Nitrospiraceae bacterium]